MATTITNRVNVQSALTGVTLYMFTLGLTHPSFGGALLDILLWPYRLGEAVATMAGYR